MSAIRWDQLCFESLLKEFSCHCPPLKKAKRAEGEKEQEEAPEQSSSMRDRVQERQARAGWRQCFLTQALATPGGSLVTTCPPWPRLVASQVPIRGRDGARRCSGVDSCIANRCPGFTASEWVRGRFGPNSRGGREINLPPSYQLL
jgi:hypothetical protein